jgi:predicted SPOUT superfamily RNA methylase MTH1
LAIHSNEVEIVMWCPPLLYPEKRSKPLAVALPASLTADLPHLREKTVKAGLIARTAAIFRVDEIIIYVDKHGTEDEGELLANILRYCETPQYLRKRIYTISALFKYVGLLPPLKIPSHTVASSLDGIKDGDFRDGVVIKTYKDGSLVDIGLDKPFLVPKKLKRGERVTVKINKTKDSLKLSVVSREEVKLYWGYTVNYEHKGLVDSIKSFNADLVIATSKYGDPITKVFNDMKDAIRKSNKILILFGSPHEGLFEICKRFKVNLSDIAHFIVNTIPFQGCETVRTEEAMLATLSIINIMHYI